MSTIRRWGNDFELQDMLATSPGSLHFATRGFALLTIAAQLAIDFPGQIVFKSGFVLRQLSAS